MEDEGTKPLGVDMPVSESCHDEIDATLSTEEGSHLQLADPIESQNDTSSKPPEPEVKRRFSRRRVLLLIRRFIQFGLFAFLLIVLILWIGNELQKGRVEEAAATLGLYDDESVCALTHNTTSGKVEFETLLSEPNNTSSPDSFVAHCGECGQCSNPHDIRIYADTTDSLYDDSVKCAKRALFSGKKSTKGCMERQVGFTEGCTDCWVDNIMCDLRKCLFVCMWHGMWNSIDSKGGSADNPAQLNPCTRCDELRCGPQFIHCAGANRRRSGILSDIKRDEDQEVCHSAKSDWYHDDVLYEAWARQTAE